MTFITENPKNQLTAHFNLIEFLRWGSTEGLTVEYRRNLKQLAHALEEARAMLGNKPIYINSGFRTVEHNKAVGGVADSQHLYGKAADITVRGMTPAMVQMVLKDWDGGMGCYDSFTHLDIGPKRRWNG